MKKFTILLLPLLLLASAIIFAQNANPGPVKITNQKAFKSLKMAAGNSTNLLNVSPQKPGGSSTYQTDETTIRYDDGINFDAIGLTSGGTFQVAAYFPAETMAQHVGMKLTKMEFYINDIPSYCKIKVYGQGTSISPGALLHEEIVSPAGLSWNLFTLSIEIEITGEDLWIGYEVIHTAGGYPCGCDGGPAVAGFGDMISLDGVAWDPLSGYGLDYNWNLVGYLDDGFIYNNDVGVTDILSPVSGTNLGDEVIKIRVKNFGTSSQTNIPVFFTVDGGTPVNGTIAGPLASGATVDYTFATTVFFGELGHTYVLHTCTTLATDEVPGNNCITESFFGNCCIYCDASTTTQSEYIANVLIGLINNSSGWQGGVADYTALYTTIEAGSSQEITIQNGNPFPEDMVCAWADWNKDYTFGTGDEQFILTNVGGTGQTFVGAVAVPAGTPDGDYRLRIRITNNTSPVPCGNAGFGEIEDYTILVGCSPSSFIIVNPTSVVQEVPLGGVAESMLEITNSGDQDLTYSIEVEYPTSAKVLPEFYNAIEAEAMLAARMAAEGISPGILSLSHSIPGGVSPVQSDEETIRYDDGVNYNAIGLISGGTFQVAAYFHASTMAQYAGMILQKLEFYINDVPDTCKIKIYGGDTWASPGPLLYEQTVFPAAHSWNIFYLDPYVDITGEDIWIGYEVTHDAGENPAGCDAGPAIAGFGDMIYFNGTWAPLSTLGLDYNWNIAAYLEASCCLNNDVGVQTFLSPVSGPDLGIEIVTLRVKNYGEVSQSNIPVSYTLDGGAPVTGILAGPLTAAATADFTFPGTVDLSNPGQTYMLVGCTVLAGDEALINDCKTASITNLIPGYCNASTTTEDEYISNVSCGDINNSSGWQSGVADFTAISTIIEAGTSQNVTITNGTPWASDRVTIWVDWNNDFTFGTGTNEEFILTNVGGTGATFSGNISVPAGQENGEYRMRIRLTYSTAPTPCGNASYGEIEDYTLKVSDGGAPDNWLTVPAPAGTVAPGATVNVTLHFDPYGLDEGIYFANLKIMNNSGNAPIFDVPVMMVVNPGVYLMVNPIMLQETHLDPPMITTRQLTVTNYGPMTVDFDVVVNTTVNSPNLPPAINPDSEARITANDVGVEAILSPVTGPLLGSEIVTISVKNYGTNAQSNIPVSYTLDGGTAVTGIVAGPVASGETVDYTFVGTVNLESFYQLFVFNACTALEPDEVTENNCKTTQVYCFIPWYCDCWTSTEDEYIANVLCGEIDNNSVWQGEVADYTGLFATIEAGASKEIIVTNGNPWASDQVTAWVDWNKDFTFGFGAADEIFVLSNVGSIGATFSGSIDVPPGTPDGDYRMRIRMTYDSEPYYCGGATYGEVEDYTIKVEGGSPQAWLSAEPLSGSLEPGESMFVNVTFCSAGLEIGEYAGTIVFNSNDPVNPVISIPAILTCGEGPCPFPPPENLWGVYNQPNTVHLAWEAPQTPGGIMRWDDGINYDGIGLANPGSFYVAARWTGYQLTDYDGLYLTNVDFFPRSNGTTVYSLKIWTGNNASTLILSQSLNGLTLNAWNSISLITPVQISSSTELWIGYECNSQSAGDYPAGCDDGPAVSGFGDMISIDGNSWSPLAGYGYNYNWNIAGTIGADGKGKPLAQPIVIGQSFSNTGASIVNGILPQTQKPEWTGVNRDLLGYNVYRDGNKINSTLVTNLFYNDVNIPLGYHSYCVTAVYPECESPSNTISLIYGLDEIEDFKTIIFPNPAKSFVNIKSQNSINQISIINNFGKVVFSGDFESNSVQINTSGFNKGVYMIQVKTLEGSIVKKLVIQ
jgi:hypothetical protein